MNDKNIAGDELTDEEKQSCFYLERLDIFG